MNLEFDGYIACMYEGEAERAILDILLDNDKFKFSREDILEEEPIPWGHFWNKMIIRFNL